MKSIGVIIQEARLKKRFSIKKVEDLTKIKAAFLINIEKENWKLLPPFATTLGFIKSIAGSLGIDEKAAVAVFKRDYSSPKIILSPKPDVSKKFVWSPKLTFWFGTGVITLAIIGYLTLQYIRFVSAPMLIVDSPKENEMVSSAQIEVSGKTDVDAKVIANNQPVIVDEDGNFKAILDVGKETNEVDIISTSRSGKITEIRRVITVKK